MEAFRNLFKNRTFSLFWLGQFISVLGDRFTQMALLTIAMILYADKGEKIAWITFYSLLPFLIFGQIFGTLADRLIRKRLMIAADILRALLVGFIPFISYHPNSLGYIYLIIFLVGILSALFSPAKMAIIHNFIEKEKLINADFAVISTVMFSTFTGLILAGYLIKIFGPYPMFYLNSFIFLISAAMVANIFIDKDKKNKIYEEPATQKKSLKLIFEDIKEGLHFIVRHQPVLRIMQLNVVFFLLCAFFYINILNYSTTVLGLFSQGFGIVLAFLGLGFCLGALFLGKRIGKLKYNNILFVGFGSICAINALFMFRPDFKFSVILVIFGGTAASLIMITLDSLFQRLTPDSLLANVFRARAIVANLVFLLSLIVAGKALSRLTYFYIFGFLWLVSFIVAGIIYLKKDIQEDGILNVNPNVIVRHIINFG